MAVNKKGFADAKKRIVSLEEEILGRYKEGLLLVKRAISLEDQLKAVLSGQIEVEKAKISKARAEAMKKEKALLSRIAGLKRKQQIYEKKKEILNKIREKSANLKKELHAIEQKISQETEELSRISNRNYGTGFYFGNMAETVPNYMDIKPATGRTFIGKVTGVENGNFAVLVVRNRFFLNDPVDILGKKGPVKRDTIKRILDIEGNEVTAARSGSTVKVLLENECSANDLLRKIEE